MINSHEHFNELDKIKKEILFNLDIPDETPDIYDSHKHTIGKKDFDEYGSDYSEDTFFSSFTATSKEYLNKRLLNSVNKYTNADFSDEEQSILKECLSFCVDNHTQPFYKLEAEDKINYILKDLFDISGDIRSYMFRFHNLPLALEHIHMIYDNNELRNLIIRYLKLELEYSLSGDDDNSVFFQFDDIDRAKISANYMLKTIRSVRNNLSSLFDIQINTKEREREKRLKVFLKNWKPPRIIEYLDTHIVGQAKAKEAAAMTLYNHVAMIVYPNIKKQVPLFIGPSGSGKTQIWRAIKNISPISIVIRDSSAITSPGFSGLSAADMLESIVKDGYSDFILVLDELDKLVTAKHDVMGTNTSQSDMGSLLKLLEDGIIVNDNGKKICDCSKITVVLLGAFSGLSFTDNEKAVGFIRPNHLTVPDETTIGERLIEYGMISEMLGRISIIALLKPLGISDYLEILNSKSDENPVNTLNNFAAIDNITFSLTDDAKLYLAKKCVKSQIGARCLTAPLSSLSITMYNKALITGAHSIIISETDLKEYYNT